MVFLPFDASEPDWRWIRASEEVQMLRGREDAPRQGPEGAEESKIRK
jgi:hypothetical protein